MVQLEVQVEVRYFARIRDAMGIAAERVTLSGNDMHAVLAALRARHGAGRCACLVAEGVRIAVNQALLEGSPALRDGDEVAFLPPVTGG